MESKHYYIIIVISVILILLLLRCLDNRLVKNARYKLIQEERKIQSKRKRTRKLYKKRKK